MKCWDCVYAEDDGFWGMMCMNRDSTDYFGDVSDGVGCELWEGRNGEDIQDRDNDADNTNNRADGDSVRRR